MWYLAILAIGVAAVAAWFYFKGSSPGEALDINRDGEVTDADARVAVTAVVEQVKAIAAAADRNKK